MAQKAPIYRDEKIVPNLDLLNQLKEAVQQLEYMMKPLIQISRSGASCGLGVDKAKRGIAADAVISIAKAIKALKGW